MSGVSITATAQGLDGLINRFKQASGRVTGITSRAIDTTLSQARQTVADGTPVLTGTAKKNWQVRRTGALEGTLWNPIMYVIFLALGTRYMNASVMLDAAIAKATQDMEHMASVLGSQIVAELSKDY